MADAYLRGWVEEQMRVGQLPAFLKRIEDRRCGLLVAVLAPGEHEYEKGQVAALQWVSDLPETIMDEADDTGVDT